MRISWLDSLEKEGHISKEAKAEIYRDCWAIIGSAGDIEKTAAQNPFPPPPGEGNAKRKAEMGKQPSPSNPAVGSKKKPSGILDTLDDVPDDFGRALQLWNIYQPAIALGLAGVKGVLHVAEPYRLHGDLDTNRKKLDSDPDFNKSERNLAKAHARFNEIASLAPSVAQDYDLTKKVLMPRLHSGLTDQDAISLGGLQRNFLAGTTRKQVGLRNFLNEKQTFQTQRDLSISLRKQAESLATVSGLAKEAKISVGRLLTQIGLVAGIPAAGGVGLGLYKQHRYEKDQNELKDRLEKSYKSLLKAEGDAGDRFRENPAKTREAFEVLSHFAPLVAVQPTAARSYVTNLLSTGSEHGATPEVIKTMTEVQKNISNSHQKPFEEGFVSGAKGLGLSTALSEATKEVGKGLASHIAGIVPGTNS